MFGAILGLLKGFLGKAVGSKLIGKVLTKKAGEAVASKAATEVAGKAAATAVGSNAIKLGKLSNIINSVSQPNTDKLNPLTRLQPRMASVEAPAVKSVLGNIVSQPKKGGLSQLLTSDSYGGNILRKTLMNMAQSGAFISSDVGQPDKNFGGQLVNSFVGAVGQASQEEQQKQFNFQEDLKKMMNEFNPADVVGKEYKGSALQDIDAFKNYIIDIGANKRGMQKGKYSSSEMMDIQNRFSQLQRKFAQYATDNKAYRDQYSEYQKSPDKYDANDFRLRSEYYVKTGRIPEGGVLTPAEVDPEIFFRNLEVTNKDRWETTQQEPWVKRSPLTEDKKKALAGTYFYTNPGLQKYVLRNKLPQWLNQYGNDKALMNTFVDPNGNFDQMKFAEFMTAHEYGNMIEPDKPDYNQREIFLNRQKDQAEQDRNRAEDKRKQLGYQAVSSYPYGDNSSGPALVFDKNRTENISLSNLESITGTKLQGAADEAVPVNFEYIDNKGRMNVTASVKDNAGNPVKRMFVVPADKAKGLVEGFYPGAWENASKSGVFKQEVPKSPVIYNQDMEDKIGLFMEKNGIKNRDEAISILRQKGIL